MWRGTSDSISPMVLRGSDGLADLHDLDGPPASAEADTEPEPVWSVADDRFDGAYFQNRVCVFAPMTREEESERAGRMHEHAGAVSGILHRSRRFQHQVMERLRGVTQNPALVKRTLLFAPDTSDSVVERLRGLLPRSRESEGGARLRSFLETNPLLYPQATDITDEAEQRKLPRDLPTHDSRWSEERDHFVLHNGRLVWSIAKKFRGRGVPHGDILTAGTTGLMVAVDRFWPGSNKFATFATWWTRQAIQLELEATGKMERSISHLTADQLKLHRFERAFYKERRYPPTAQDVAAHFGIDVAQATRIISSKPRTVSLDAEHDEDFRLLDALAAPEDDEQAQEREEMHATLALGMIVLKERERFVLCMRTGLPMRGIVNAEAFVPGVPIEARSYSLQEIAHLLHLTKERIRQIENKAKQKMARPSNPQHRAMLSLLPQPKGGD